MATWPLQYDLLPTRHNTLLALDDGRTRHSSVVQIEAQQPANEPDPHQPDQSGGD